MFLKIYGILIVLSALSAAALVISPSFGVSAILAFSCYVSWLTHRKALLEESVDGRGHKDAFKTFLSSTVRYAGVTSVAFVAASLAVVPVFLFFPDAIGLYSERVESYLVPLIALLVGSAIFATIGTTISAAAVGSDASLKTALRRGRVTFWRTFRHLMTSLGLVSALEITLPTYVGSALIKLPLGMFLLSFADAFQALLWPFFLSVALGHAFQEANKRLDHQDLISVF